MWNDHVLKTLRASSGGQDYVLLASEGLVGIHIGLFAKRTISTKVTEIATSKVKLGLSGKVGSKGAALVRFLFEDTSFCFINCHLDSGSTILDYRKRSQQIGEIFASAFVKDRGTSGYAYSVLNHQVKVVLGDLNFKIGLDTIACRKLVASKDYEELHKHEEFSRYTQKDSEIMRDFKEGPLYFDPTYKYQFNSGEYDVTRIPAWADRICFEAREAENLRQVLYARAEIKLSDHRPVVGLFEAKIRRINEARMAELEEKVIADFQAARKEEEIKQQVLKIDAPLEVLDDPTEVSTQAMSVPSTILASGLSSFEKSDDTEGPSSIASVLPSDDVIPEKVEESPSPLLILEKGPSLKELQAEATKEHEQRDEQLEILFFPKKFELKEPGESVGSVIKKIGIFHEDDDEEAPKKEEKPAAQSKKPLFGDSEEEEEVTPAVVAK